ncbi:hypothetical protein ACHAXA_007720 [Cyclostephanos tholiformis]|uniref:Uncharacterized protein n=1 Tax=Cyclostephanos tholiformis TaxID=382380 RepID=A0ABD3RYA1_9STRA
MPLYHEDPYRRGCHPTHQAREVSSCPPIIQKMNPTQGRRNSFYTAGGYGSAYERRSPANAILLGTTASERSDHYDYDYATAYSKGLAISSMEPTRRPLAGGGTHNMSGPHMRSRSNVD